MSLAFKPPLAPMLAKLSSHIPTGEGWLYEPKWDGFRALVFAADDDDDVYLQSRDLKPLARYFPELASGLRATLSRPCVLDGEIVIERNGTLDFDALLLRIHPAASRIELLAQQTPAVFVAWDLLAVDDEDLRARPLQERRARLEELLEHRQSPLFLAPATRDHAQALEWFRAFEGAGLDGVVSKRLDGLYTPGVRSMVKTKHARTADCVVGGFRWFKGHEGKLVGSLLLGLFDDEGVLQHVGVCGAFSTEKRRELAVLLEPWRAPVSEQGRAQHPWAGWAEWQKNDEDTQRKPGATSRWSAGKDLSWEPLRPELVAEVVYDHLQGARFRHATQFVRWRTDKTPAECRYDQLEVTPPLELASIFARPDARKGGRRRRSPAAHPDVGGRGPSTA
ncbi:MAG: ATP-dependent DNA ligase [Deltaproteobacteria bacterium]|nr:ATP-dependent DNA ligase [Deltaproteobacteria bacterium]